MKISKKISQKIRLFWHKYDDLINIIVFIISVLAFTFFVLEDYNMSNQELYLGACFALLLSKLMIKQK